MSTATESTTSPAEIREHLAACYEDPFYFIDRFCHIYEGNQHGGRWVRFRLWHDQVDVLDTIHGSQKSAALKARQLGFSWLAICYALWQMIFRPQATVLIFSKRDDEATELLAMRLRGVYYRLPDWLKPGLTTDNGHEVGLQNGSRAMAFPTTGGRSYTGTLAIVDEADFVPDLAALLDAVGPTVEHGGKLILISTVDKTRPMSAFKRIYQAARTGTNGYAPIFCPWSTRPERTQAWYEAKRAEILSRDGSLDLLWQEYPATDTEALAPKVLDKRIPADWLQQCYQEAPAIAPSEWPEHAPSVPGLIVYRLPRVGGRYVIGADPAEGNPTSDDSAAHVLDVVTGEEVAAFVGKHQPTVFAEYIDQVGQFYNGAAVMCERNNHGHAVIGWLRGNSPLMILAGHDEHDGWLSSVKGKALLYNACADAFRQKDTLLHSFETFTQLSTIEGNTLRAPEGLHDDRADSYALALCGVVAATGLDWTAAPADARESFMHQAPRGVFGADWGEEG